MGRLQSAPFGVDAKPVVCAKSPVGYKLNLNRVVGSSLVVFPRLRHDAIIPAEETEIDEILIVAGHPNRRVVGDRVLQGCELRGDIGGLPRRIVEASVQIGRHWDAPRYHFLYRRVEQTRRRVSFGVTAHRDNGTQRE